MKSFVKALRQHEAVVQGLLLLDGLYLVEDLEFVYNNNYILREYVSHLQLNSNDYFQVNKRDCKDIAEINTEFHYILFAIMNISIIIL